MEWAEPTLHTPLPDDRNGRLHDRVGSLLTGEKDWGSLVPGREGVAYQLPGTAWSNPSGEMFCQRAEQSLHPAENGQHISYRIHKQTGGHSLPTVEPTHQRSMVVVHEQEHHTESCPPSRAAEHNSRRGVQSNKGQNRLATLSGDIPSDQQATGPTSSGSICLQTLFSAPRLCELEARPGSNGLRSVQPELDTPEGVCEPPLEPDRQSPVPSEGTEGAAGPRNPTVESTAVVPSTPKHDNTNPDLSAEQARSLPTNTPVQQTRHISAASRVDYLRERYRSQRISGDASKLLLASWTQKSSKSYDSLFTKWASWCSERGSDPISGDISEVVNFLAFKKIISTGLSMRTDQLYPLYTTGWTECRPTPTRRQNPKRGIQRTPTPTTILTNLGCQHGYCLPGQSRGQCKP